MEIIHQNKNQNFWVDTKGRLVPVETIREIDQLRHNLVIETVQKALELKEQLKQAKLKMFDDIAAFVELSAEKYGIKRGGQKGNVSLLSFDGKYKLQFTISESLSFDERIHAAKILIDECLHDWTQDSRNEIKLLIDSAFDVDKEGKLSTTKILGLRRVKINDKRWIEAMNAIADSIQITTSKAYIRVYERDNEDNYKKISLDIAEV